MPRPINFLRNNAIGSDERKRTIDREVKIGPVTMRALTIASLAALLLLYLAQTTQSATKQYEIEELHRQKQELVDEVDRLELEALRLQSLRTIEDSIKKDQLLEPVNEVKAIE